MEQKIRILLAEDDENLGFVVKDYLEMKGYEVDWRRNGKQGLQAFFQSVFELCIFDVMMPEKDGFTLAEEVRKLNPDVPVIFLTAKTMQEDRIKGYRIGADDYITKPFSAEEFLLRVEAVLKRCNVKLNQQSKKNVFHIGKYVFDYDNLALVFDKHVQQLTKREADILKLLYINRNELLTRETALNIIWGSDDYFMGRSMDVFITKLRKYLKNDPNITIQNVHGIGFKMMVE